MRRCLLDDLVAAAHCISAMRGSDRHDLAERMIWQAHAAHHYHRRFGRPHPRWGNGSLMARVLSEDVARDLPLCLSSLAIVAAAVDRFRKENARRRVGLSEPPLLCYHGCPWN